MAVRCPNEEANHSPDDINFIKKVTADVSSYGRSDSNAFEMVK